MEAELLTLCPAWHHFLTRLLKLKLHVATEIGSDGLDAWTHGLLDSKALVVLIDVAAGWVLSHQEAVCSL